MRGAHNADNNSNFALRALLLLSYNGHCPDTSSLQTLRTLVYLKRLAEEPVADTRQRNTGWRATRLKSRDSGEDVLSNSVDSILEGY